MDSGEVNTIKAETGRIVTKGTAWWYSHSDYDRTKLNCVHNISLTKKYGKCDGLAKS